MSEGPLGSDELCAGDIAAADLGGASSRDQEGGTRAGGRSLEYAHVGTDLCDRV